MADEAVCRIQQVRRIRSPMAESAFFCREIDASLLNFVANICMLGTMVELVFDSTVAHYMAAATKSERAIRRGAIRTATA